MVSYNALISACEKGSNPQQAMQLLQDMSIRGQLPNVITCSAAISACEKGRTGATSV